MTEGENVLIFVIKSSLNNPSETIFTIYFKTSLIFFFKWDVLS